LRSNPIKSSKNRPQNKKRTVEKMNLIVVIVILLISVQTNQQQPSNNQAPRIEQHPNSIIVNVSDPVTLECRASGVPKPRIMWTKDGVELPLHAGSQRYTLIHESNLFIYAASLGKTSSSGTAAATNQSDAGVYQCRAENEHGVAMSSNASLALTYLREDFREMPKSRQVNAGALVILDCKAPRGLPEPKIGLF
jgi:hypothetical protein